MYGEKSEERRSIRNKTRKGNRRPHQCYQEEKKGKNIYSYSQYHYWIPKKNNLVLIQAFIKHAILSGNKQNRKDGKPKHKEPSRCINQTKLQTVHIPK